MPDVLMPRLGADMEDGVLVQWRVAVGDVVLRTTAVAYIETSKGAFEVEAFAEGVVEALLAAPGEVVPVGAPLVRLRTG